ncbi:MAG: germination protein YpeB [Oscillospiraceae bacterium]
MKKKTAVLIISFLTVGAIALGGVAWVNFNRVQNLENALSINRHHAFAELVTGMKDLDTSLQKSLYATSPSVMSAVCTDVFGKALTAQLSLSTLPFSAHDLEKTAAFISRVGDYAYTLSQSDEAYTEDELANLRQLSTTASALAQNFQNVQQQLTEGGLSMDEMFLAGQEMDSAEENIVSANLTGGVRTIEEEFPEIPTLIYDGPFSEHITETSPKLLEGRANISEAEARDKAAKFLGVEAGKLQSMGKSQGDIPCYYFSTDYMTIQVTEQGGEVIYFLSSHAADKAALSAEDAMAIAKKFLTERGYDNMKDSYHMTQDNICTVNFAYEDDGVLCYPDLIKVSVALDSGNVVGFEAAGYVASHTDRQIPEAAVSRDEAQKKVAADLTVQSHRLCIIPTAGQYEKFCHEFVCTSESGGDFIIYVNAETGEQEKILILLIDENGSLTI